MTVTMWGTRGSIPAAGPDTERYGGNTSCVEIVGADGTVLVLDAGTGIRRLGAKYTDAAQRMDLFLTHLHMDHLQGLGFFAPLYAQDKPVHIWGPASATLSLQTRLTRYMSPPLFPVRLRDVPCALQLHEVPCEEIHIGEFTINSLLICHPGPTVGYRIQAHGVTLTYIPDHEPALAPATFAREPGWTSGYTLAQDAEVLIHDAQYSNAEYLEHIGWGHSSIEDTIRFAEFARVKRLIPFHYDPAHDDNEMDVLLGATLEKLKPHCTVTPAREGMTFEI